jgi:hypothetical protein
MHTVNGNRDCFNSVVRSEPIKDSVPVLWGGSKAHYNSRMKKMIDGRCIRRWISIPSVGRDLIMGTKCHSSDLCIAIL